MHPWAFLKNNKKHQLHAADVFCCLDGVLLFVWGHCTLVCTSLNGRFRFSLIQLQDTSS